ncbi:hypothetical protein [Amycolatopsis sp. CA-230715]|uniref:hypothetical protein n=1 Tax=Amycolatopsis sp. CA-230715 TaxID=2745196 RepID=UPI001C01A444|nr:hypothetical protein [Amycolatopsis sp. CA-230715]QWF81135.1 hypothetical protein HUW46_04561 [Amycolatopsis sp. CA-230715]
MITFELTTDDGHKSTVDATARDVLMWEKTTKGAKFGDFQDGSGLTLAAMYKIAWFAAKRVGVVDGVDLAEFERDYDVVPIGDDDADPTSEDR